MPNSVRTHKPSKTQSYPVIEQECSTCNGCGSGDESSVSGADGDTDSDEDASVYEDAYSQLDAAYDGSMKDDSSDFGDAFSDADADSDTDQSEASDSEYMDALTGFEAEESNFAVHESIGVEPGNTSNSSEADFADDSGYEYDTDVTLVGEQVDEDHAVKSTKEADAIANNLTTPDHGTKG